MIIRSKTFKAWFNANLKEYASDIANHGADAGYPYISYTSDTVTIYNHFESEIWDMLNEAKDEMGYKSVPELITTFGRIDMADDPDQFKNLLVWFACETLAREISDN
jgi:hypothetical protein